MKCNHLLSIQNLIMIMLPWHPSSEWYLASNSWPSITETERRHWMEVLPKKGVICILLTFSLQEKANLEMKKKNNLFPFVNILEEILQKRFHFNDLTHRKESVHVACLLYRVKQYDWTTSWINSGCLPTELSLVIILPPSRVKVLRKLDMWNSCLGGASCKSNFCNMVRSDAMLM